MSEPGFREIQLSTKQVVFLFMAGVVAAVAIFLLGVSAGRGANTDEPNAEAAPPEAAADTKSTEMPPATTPKPGDLQYHDALQGKAEAKGTVPPPVPPPDAPPPTPTPTPTPTATPAAKVAQTPMKPAAPTGKFFVQVDSFGSRANADRRVADLKERGVTAFIVDEGGPGARYRVRVGPYVDEAAAEVMVARLRKEGFRPRVTR